jgi:hypothetical protein
MRNMSFAITTAQIMDETKTVTRRNGWENLKVGEIFQAIEKGQGLKRGERVNRLKVLQCVGNRRERLYKMIKDKAYGQAEMIKEGFPDMGPMEFISMYCNANKGTHPGDEVSRVEFRYLIKSGTGHYGEGIKVPARVIICPMCQRSLTVYPEKFVYMLDSTILCDEFTFDCEGEPGIRYYSNILGGHLGRVDAWLAGTYRFDLDD